MEKPAALVFRLAGLASISTAMLAQKRARAVPKRPRKMLARTVLAESMVQFTRRCIPKRELCQPALPAIWQQVLKLPRVAKMGSPSILIWEACGSNIFLRLWIHASRDVLFDPKRGLPSG
jgi:hypothetical protein